MSYTRGAATANVDRAGTALRRNARAFSPWHMRSRRFPSIVQYADGAVPSNDYPARIVSPRRAAVCCAFGMVNIGGPQEASGWLFQYRRCQWCGFTVRRILRAVPDKALLAQLRRALAHSFVRETGESGTEVPERGAVGRSRRRCEGM
jgi:hypothetical protein